MHEPVESCGIHPLRWIKYTFLYYHLRGGGEGEKEGQFSVSSKVYSRSLGVVSVPQRVAGTLMHEGVAFLDKTI